MLLGVFFLVLTGFFWTAIGIAVSYAAANGLNYGFIQGVKAVGSLVISFVVLLFIGLPEVSLQFYGFIALLLAVSGACNFFSFLCMNRAMKHGHNGMIWSLFQAALLCPFLLGIFLFGVELTLLRSTGILLILAGILLLGTSRDDGSPDRSSQAANRSAAARWLLPTTAAILLAGLTQCLNNLPSYWPEALPVGGVHRAMFSQAGSLAAFLAVSRGKVISGAPGSVKRAVWIAVILLVLNCLTGYFLFYNGLNRVAEAGAGSIGYPVTVAVCIIGFLLYSTFVMHERQSPRRWTGMAGTLLGIIMISIK